MKNQSVFLLVALLAVAPLAGAADAASALDYQYPLSFDDAEGDAQLCTQQPACVPFGEADVLKVEVTDDGADFVVRTTMATFDFTGGTVTLNIPTTGPNQEAWDITIVWDENGEVTNVADFDSDQTTGDGDEAMPGARAELDTENGFVYLFAAKSELGVSEGKQITFRGNVNSGRGAAIGTFNDVDSVATADTAYTFNNNAQPPAPEPTEDPPIYEDLDEGVVDHEWQTATSDTFVFNWTDEGGNLTASYQTTVANGTVNLTLTDPDGMERINETFDADTEQSLEMAGVAAGNWTLRLEYSAFEGSLSFRLQPTSDETPTPTDSGTPTSTGTGTTTPTQTGTSSPTSTGGEEGSNQTPGFTVFALLAVLGAVLALRRRTE